MSLDLLDEAIGEVEGHRRSPVTAPDDDGPDPVVFDRRTLGELLGFLQEARRRLLTVQEAVEEAQHWQQLVDVGWPARSNRSPLERVVALLAEGLPDGTDLGGSGSGPGDEDRGFASDAAGSVLPSAGPTEGPGEGPRADMARPGSPLPAGDDGGERAVLPHPHSVEVTAPGPDDDQRAVLLTAALAVVPGCVEARWAVVRRRGGSPGRDVLVVTAVDPDTQAVVVEELRAALPPCVFPEAIVVGRSADLVHPLVEQVVAVGRTVTPL